MVLKSARVRTARGRRRPARIVAFVLALLVYAAALFAAWAMSFAAAMGTLPIYSATTTATVTAMVTEVFPYGDDDYRPCGPRYTFMLDGVAVSASSPNVSERYCSLAVGGPIDITYDPSEPTSSAPSPRYDRSPAWVPTALAVGGHVVLALGIAALVAGRSKRSERHLPQPTVESSPR